MKFKILVIFFLFLVVFSGTSSASIGDLNNDSKVYFSDVVIIVKWILNLDRTNAASDVNSDGQVNIFDIVKVAVLLGKQYSADSAVPILSEGRPNINFSAGTTEAVVYVRTDERATCKYSSSSGTAFGSMTQFKKTGGIFHSRLATGLQNGGTYNYYVKCQDEAGNLNSTDYFITFSISGTDTSAPTQPSGLNATAASSTQINLTWNAATDNVAVTGYRIYRCQGTCTPSIAIANVTSGTSYSNTVLTASTQYTYSVSAYDARGNDGVKSSTASATTQAADTTAPVRSSGSPSSNLSAGTTQTTLSLITNEAATCKYGTIANTAYASIANTFAVTGSTSHSQLVTGLTNGTSYNYYVRCNDTVGNVNTNDYGISFGVNPDTTPPTVTITAPTQNQILPAGTTSTTLSVTTNENANCRYSTTDQSYSLMPSNFTTTGSTSHSTTLTGLADGNSYTRYIRCQDSAGNPTTSSQSISFSVASGGAIIWNEPAGYTPVVGRHFNTRATTSSSGRGAGVFPYKTGDSEGWDSVEYNYNSYQSIVQDNTAPLSQPSVLQYFWPAQTVAAGTTFAPGIAQTQSFTGPAHGNLQLTKIYHRFAYKLSSNFQIHPSGIKVLFHRTNDAPLTGGGWARCEPILVIRQPAVVGVNVQGCQDNARDFGQGANGLTFANTPGASQTDANNFQFGQWYTFEVQLELNSAYNVPDGKLFVWMKGPSNQQPVLIISYTDLKLIPSALVTGMYWDAIHQGQTWGGQGGTINQDMYSYMDDDYVSGAP